MTSNAKAARPVHWWERVPRGATLAEYCGMCGRPLTILADEARCLRCEQLLLR
jgi:hypothetical protein